MLKKIFILLFFLVFFSSYHCGRSPSPRVVVMDFMEAVNTDDTTTIEKYLDLDRFTQEKLKDLPPEQRAEAFPKIKEQLRNNLLGSGGTRLKWQNKMIVVNKETIEGDEASVEVTFVDQKTGLTLYTKTKLYKKDKAWKIYYFKD
ncbi:MAG: hypothetical protein AMJ89_03660 [candidate division Zixibacteria bacterium SM23_73]|nr:MAG: hypothetical protein AMJ89_03660 [candidate division Zixibacteria bacterium SM23_73]